jgi:hypothetical protein
MSCTMRMAWSTEGPPMKLDELALQELAAELVAVVLLGQAVALGFSDERGRLEAVSLGHRLDRVIDLVGRHTEVSPIGRVLYESIVDHALEKLLIELRLVRSRLRLVQRGAVHAEAERVRPVHELGEKDRSLADDGDHALDDRRLRDGWQGEPDEERCSHEYLARCCHGQRWGRRGEALTAHLSDLGTLHARPRISGYDSPSPPSCGRFAGAKAIHGSRRPKETRH